MKSKLFVAVMIVVGAAALLLSLAGPALAADAQPDALQQAAADLERGRIGFAGDALGVNVGDTDIASDHVYDYTFSSAPTDWLARSGEWNATNRWTCSPQWSWYGGYSPNGVAAMWNKRYFEGDQTVEWHCAFKMRLGRDPVYLHPNDLNITLCGDGVNLDSGYAFIIGGEENRWTRIMRGDRVLAETRDPGGLWPIYENGQPTTYEWHRKWWSVRVRKAGTKLQLYLDERLALEATDPQPLSGGHTAIWVLRNDMITPRLKIYAEREKLPRPPMPDDGVSLAAETTVAAPQVTLSSTTHPSVQNDFENDLGRVATRDADQGALLTLVADSPDGKGHSLKVVNRAAGGNFGATLLSDRFDARQLSQIAFDYKLTPDVKVNFYLNCGETPYEIRFSGKPTAAPGCTMLGEFTGVAADGKWHHAEFDLLGALQERQGLAAATACSDLWVGNLSNEDYLLAGFSGNHWAATWLLDNFYLGQPAGAKAQVTITPRSGADITGYAVAVDAQPEGQPVTKVTQTQSTVDVDLNEDGARFVHVRPELKGGQWGNTVTYALEADRSAPKVSATDPAADGSLSDGLVTFKLQEPGGSGVDLAALKLKLGDKELALGAPGVDYNPEQCSVQVDLRAAGVQLVDGGKLSAALLGLKDRAGNAQAEPQQFTFLEDLKNDKLAPSLTRLQLSDPYLADDDFEQGMGEWQPYGGSEGAVLSRDDSTANSGRYSLRLYCPGLARRFGAYCVQRPFDAGKYRLVSFAYKCDDRLRADFAVYVNGDWKGIKFTDNDNDLGVIGQVPGVQTDNKWHVATFDLYDMLRRDDPSAPTFIVRQFVIADWGWRGNRVAATYHLDDFQIIPVVSGAAPLAATWSAADAAGFEGAAYSVDKDANGTPPATINGLTNQIAFNLSGMIDAWLHVRAKDKAGNWGQTLTRHVLVDSQMPTAQSLEPIADTRAASSVVRLALHDDGLAGVDPTSVRLQVAGQEYVVDGQGLSYLPQTSELVWNCENIYPNPVVFPNHKSIKVALVAAADYAGNKVSALPSWTWEMDYALDRKAPVPSEIHSTSHPTLVTNTFEDGLGVWENRGGASGAKVELDTSEAASGKACVKLTQQSAGGNMQATVWNQPYPVERYPIIAFDYRIPAETRLVLNFLVSGQWYAVMLNDAAPGVVGSVAGIVADNRWRHAQFDLLPILRRQVQQGTLVVDQVVIGDREPITTPAGAVARFDNFIIGQIGRYPPVVRWRATDTTGIQGYSYSLDRNPGTVPDEVSEGTEVAKTFDNLEPGIWYLHLRAEDGAGNWGAPATYALLHMKAE